MERAKEPIQDQIPNHNISSIGLGFGCDVQIGIYF